MRECPGRYLNAAPFDLIFIQTMIQNRRGFNFPVEMTVQRAAIHATIHATIHRTAIKGGDDYPIDLLQSRHPAHFNAAASQVAALVQGFLADAQRAAVRGRNSPTPGTSSGC